MIPEELLRRASTRSCIEHVNEITKDYDPDNQHEFSPEFERRIKKLTRRARHPLLYKCMQRVASFALAVVLTGGIWLAVDVEARAAFVGWVKGVYESFFVYRYEGQNETKPESAQYQPNWIPDGYQEVFSDFSDGEGGIVYSNDSGQFLQFGYISNPNNSNHFIATEDTVHYATTVRGYHADFFASTSPAVSSSIAWTDENECAFYVSGFLEKDELIKIAENIEKLKK